jgi:hypothetical protein
VISKGKVRGVEAISRRPAVRKRLPIIITINGKITLIDRVIAPVSIILLVFPVTRAPNEGSMEIMDGPARVPPVEYRGNVKELHRSIVVVRSVNANNRCGSGGQANKPENFSPNNQLQISTHDLFNPFDGRGGSIHESFEVLNKATRVLSPYY